MARAAIHGAVLIAACALSGCGKEGPPLPPLRPEPGHIREVTATRFDDRVEIRMNLPAANFDGTTPPVMERVEIYMIEAAANATAPGASELIDSKHLHHLIALRRADTKPGEPGAKATPAPGETAVFVDRIDPSRIGVAGAPTRHYLVLGATGRSRRGRPSPIMPVPLAPRPATPSDMSITYDEKTLTLRWTGAAGQSFRVFEAPPGRESVAATELTKEPIAAPEFQMPVVFGVGRCFLVQTIATDGRVSIVGPAGPPRCETPVDTFRPPQPAGLLAVQEEKGITLRWNAVEAADLAGYLILRGEGTGERLQQLSKTPVAETTYVDTAVTPGVTYVYAVVAVDKAGNVSEQSNRQQVTARAPGARSHVSGMR